jgi:hydroxymethylpyrimidine/phosphomethylpyrimidine kinase
MYTALTIAGSDPSGGAGIQGDLKTFHAHGVYGMAVLTALTVQNTTGVFGVHDVPPEFVSAQLEAVLDDMPVGAAKTGMVSVIPTIEAIASVLRRRRLPHLIVDPVMIASSGDALLRDDAVSAIVERLFPLADVITPNIPEAGRLLDRRIETVTDMRQASEDLKQMCPGAVLITGGHLSGPQVVDILYCDGVIHEFSDPRVETEHNHGSGCALAAGVAAQLARGSSVPEAVARARAFVRRGLETAAVLGRGRNPLNHLAAGG